MYPQPKLSITAGLWFTTQNLGLADGLRKIHGTDTGQNVDRVYGRHGDLKPENILWFKSPSPGVNDSDAELGVLQISDFGLARFHRTASSTKTNARAVAFSPTYRPPECDVGDRLVSQSYDIWSLGCLILEFTTWYLMGWNEVETFSRKRTEKVGTPVKEDEFFGVVTGDIPNFHEGIVKPSVLKVSVRNPSLLLL